MQLAVDDTVKALGRLDILVNNAGVLAVAPVTEFDLADFDRMLAVNVRSVFVASQRALPHMLAQRWGRIINVASAHGLVASPFKSAYVAAKHGVVGLTKVTALEAAGQGITAASVSPRVDMALDLLLGRRQLYVQEPTSFYFPGLPQRQFYEAQEFDWAEEFEVAASAMRAELDACLLNDEEMAAGPDVWKKYEDALDIGEQS